MTLFGIDFFYSSLITLFSLSGRRIFSDGSKDSSRERAKKVSTTTSGTYGTVDKTSTTTSGTNETVAAGTDDAHGTEGCEGMAFFSPTTPPLYILNFGTPEK
ncbi:hypothetical protein Fot_19959 [Forsythia ovata]|uniref:Uncharacterized protein n=1 Tax=Forsythia ovata TaxID=205694 RepID=A0ABD1VP66_9LAMI